MKRFCAAVLLLAGTLALSAAEKSPTVVYINGAKYYIHTVQPGETLYGLSKLYAVGEQVILQNNPDAAGGLKADAKLRIPFVSEVKEQPSERKLRRSFDFHYVAKGETFYAISRRYEIPVRTLLEDNPDVDPTQLRLGERILIRKKQIGSEDEAGAQAGWEEYRQHLSSALESEGYGVHIVQAGETFYSLSHRYGITEAELGALNDGLRPEELRAGAMIRVPSTGGGAAADTVAEETPAADTLRRSVPVEFRALRRSEVLDVALLLPLTSEKGAANTNFAEFYQGFLLGLDSVKHRYGYSVNLHLYNSVRDSVRVREIVESPAFEGTDLIVGPVYEEALYPAVRYAERNSIPVVSPLAHIERMESDALFQLAPDPTHKYDKLADLIDGSRRITLIYTESTDREFEREILELLQGRSYSKHTYRYAHHSASQGGSADLTPLVGNGEENLFVVMADKQVDVDRILASIASANTSLTSRGHATPRFTVLGNARWNRYANIDRSMFFKDHVVFISTYHAKRNDERIVAFDKAYIRAFGALPSLYAYRGFDTAMIFVPGMYNDIEYDLEDRRYAPLQTAYLFGQEGDNPNHVNGNWMRVDYNDDFTITVR